MLHSLLGTAALLLVGCVDPFFLEARAVAVCQHLPAQRFEVPTALREPPLAVRRGMELQRTFDFDVSAQLPPETAAMLQSHFALTSVRLTAVNPGDDLGFVDEARLQLQPGTSGSDLEARVFDYLRTEEAPRMVAWDGAGFEVAAYFAAGNLKYTVSLVGSPPARDVVVDLDACAEVTVRLDYL